MKPNAFLDRALRLSPIQVRDYLLDVPARKLFIAGEPVGLTPLQVLLTAALLEGPCHSELLWQKVWGYDGKPDRAGHNTIMVNMHYFRRVVGDRLAERQGAQRVKEWLLR